MLFRIKSRKLNSPGVQYYFIILQAIVIATYVMENHPLNNIVFSKNVVEFVTVGVQFCSFLETFNDETTATLTDKLTKIFPLLYLKSAMLPDIEMEYDIFPEVTVTEENYNYIVSRLYAVYKSNDTYLEVFLEDMKYSDTPISASISEDVADIYQDIKNFVSVYEQGIEDNMYEALASCQENFKQYWGQKLVNVLRALHSIKYSLNVEPEDDNESNSDNEDDLW